MQAARIVRPGEVEVFESPRPVAGGGQVLLRVECLGLCGSDLATYRGRNPLAAYPRIPGHEIAGEMVSVGRGVAGSLQVGQRVAVVPYTACGVCSGCRQGRPNCCRDNQTLGVQRDGGAAEYLAVEANKVLGTEGLEPEQVACIEPLSVGHHACSRGAVRQSDTVVVLGCGMIGLGAIAAASVRGARVVAVDVDASKLAKARALGAAEGIDSSVVDLGQRVSELTDGEGPEVVIEAVGQGATFLAAVELASFGGRVVYIGYAKEPVAYETKLFVSKELDIRGSRNALWEDFEAVRGMLESGRIATAPLVTGRYGLGDLGLALRQWDAAPGTVTKTVICPGPCR